MATQMQFEVILAGNRICHFEVATETKIKIKATESLFEFEIAQHHKMTIGSYQLNDRNLKD